MTSPSAHPVLYSFRRCPYAMRARMAIAASGTICEIREVSLKDKPLDMIDASPKATVPVVVLPDQSVIEQSFDIMLWTLTRNDPAGWLMPETGTLAEMITLIERTEDEFKVHLDRYKYATRYEGADPLHHRSEGLMFLGEVNTRLAGGKHLFGDRPALADYAIFPFVRQFANTDRPWFDALELPALKAWLGQHLAAPLFEMIMRKRRFWQPGEAPVLFPATDRSANN